MKTFTALYIDIIASICILLAALFVVIFKVSGTNAGLALTNALQLVLFVPWLVRMIGELHSSMNSVSAVAQFAKSIPREVLLFYIYIKYRDNDATKVTPPDNWPKEGEV